jgi:hypothetical protein
LADWGWSKLAAINATVLSLTVSSTVAVHGWLKENALK